MDNTTFKHLVLKRYQPGTALFSTGHGLNLNEEGLTQDFIATLTRAFEEDINFRYSEFNVFPMELLVDYISRTHDLYLNKTLHEIEQSLGILNQAYTLGHPLLELLNDFYLDYKHDLIHHIREEDDNLIPYIEYLESASLNGFKQFEFHQEREKFNIAHFFENHEENDCELEKIQQQILTYDPPPTNRFIYGVLVNQLALFEQDLKIHGLIEEQVLIPRALETERKLTGKFLKGVRLN